MGYVLLWVIPWNFRPETQDAAPSSPQTVPFLSPSLPIYRELLFHAEALVFWLDSTEKRVIYRDHECRWKLIWSEECRKKKQQPGVIVSHSLIFSGPSHWGLIKTKQKLDQEPHKYDDKGWRERPRTCFSYSVSYRAGFLFGKILFFILTEISPQRIGELCRVTTGGIKLIERLSSSSSFSPFSFFPLKENKHIQSRY